MYTCMYTHMHKLLYKFPHWYVKNEILLANTEHGLTEDELHNLADWPH